MEIKLTEETIKAIEYEISRGRVVEVKREKDNVVVVGIERKVNNKSAIVK